MWKIAITALTIFCLYPPPARSQDALGTFIFLFLDGDIDVTHDYGKEFAREAPPYDFRTAHQTISITNPCVFESRIDETSVSTRAPNEHRLGVWRWDFNKAFFMETKVKTFLDGSVEITIPGDKGLTYSSCLPDSLYCMLGPGRPNQDDEITLKASSDKSDRVLKALKYFVQNFCSGTKRKSAF